MSDWQPPYCGQERGCLLHNMAAEPILWLCWGVVLREVGARLAPKGCLFYVGPDLEEPALKMHSSWNPQGPPFTSSGKKTETVKVKHRKSTCMLRVDREFREVREGLVFGVVSRGIGGWATLLQGRGAASEPS